MLWASALRRLAGQAALHHALLHRLKTGAAIAAYVWSNLILLRSAALCRHRLPFRCARRVAVRASHAVPGLERERAGAHALLRTPGHAAQLGGAIVLGIEVLKLFLVDLASGGGIARVVSCFGVGLLLLLVGYFAPYPKTAHGEPSPASA